MVAYAGNRVVANEGNFAINKGKDKTALEASEVRSIHLHMRFDKSLLSTISQEDLKAWMARLSDAIYLYRLTYKSPLFVMRFSVLQTRLRPQHLRVKGTLKLISDDDPGKDYGIKNADYKGQGLQYDLEFRGMMSDDQVLEEFATEVSETIKNPQIMKGYTDYQALSYTPTASFSKLLNLWASKNDKAQIGHDTAQKLETYIQRRIYGLEDYAFRKGRLVVSNDRVFLPALGLEFMPYLSPVERETIKKANHHFWQQLYDLLNTQDLDDLLAIEVDKDGNSLDSYHDKHQPFYRLFKKWTQQTRYYDILKSSLFSAKENHEESLLQDKDFVLYLVDKLPLKEAKNIIRKISPPFFISLIAGHDLSLEQKSKIIQFLYEEEFFSYRLAVADSLKDLELEKIKKYLVYPDIQTPLRELGLWDQNQCKKITQKLKDIGLQHPVDLLVHHLKINDLILKYNQGQIRPKDNLSSFHQKSLTTIHQFLAHKMEDQARYQQFLFYMKERLNHHKSESQLFQKQLQLLGFSTYEDLQKHGQEINQRIKSYNKDHPEQIIRPFKDKTLVTFKRVLMAMERLDLI